MIRPASALFGAFALSLLLGCGGKPGAKPSAAERQMIEDLDAMSAEARLTAVVQLGQLQSKPAVRGLVKCLKDIRLDVRKAAVDALGNIGDDSAAPALAQIVANRTADEELRRMATSALGQIKSPVAVATLVEALHSETVGLPVKAAQALAEIRHDSAADALITAAADTNLVTRRAAANVIARTMSPRATETLRRLLKDADASIRLAAAEQLAQAGDQASYATLATMLMDPDETVRLGIRRSVVRLGTAVPVDALCDILRISDATVARDDGSGNTVQVPVKLAKDTARDIALQLSGPDIIRPILIMASANRGGLSDALRDQVEAQMGDPATRAELYRVMEAGGDTEKLIGFTVLDKFFGGEFPGDGGLQARQKAVAGRAFPDAADVTSVCIKALKSKEDEIRFYGARTLCALGDPRGKPELLKRFWDSIAVLKTAWGDAGKAWEEENGGLDAEQLKKDEAERIARFIAKAKSNGRFVGDINTSAQTTPAELALKRKLDYVNGKTPREPISLAIGCLVGLSGVYDKALIEQLRPVLKIGDPRLDALANIEAHVVRMMAGDGNPAYADELLELMRKVPHGGDLSTALAESLGRLHVKEAFDPIADRLESMRVDQYFVRLRAACYEALFGCDPDRAVDTVGQAITNMLPHRVDNIENATTVYAKHPHERSINYLIFWIDHDIKHVKDHVQAMIQKVGQANLEWLVAGFDVPDENKRSVLAGVIADGFGSDAEPFLRKAIASENPRLRQGAIWTYACIRGSEAAEAIGRGLTDPHPGVRSAAAWAVGNMPIRAMAPRLLELLKDGDATPRAMAAKQLGAVGTADSIEPLMAVLKDADPRVRAYATMSLADLKAHVAFDPIQALLEDEDPDVKAAATYAVAKLNPSAEPEAQ